VKKRTDIVAELEQALTEQRELDEKIDRRLWPELCNKREQAAYDGESLDEPACAPGRAPGGT
jgi:hypothetical protein